jgi:NAD(P)-dependent dehydrogenase (short-subunit alcohol dehydrogenase family)
MTNREKVALVTGANKGIGMETVRQLVSNGVKTYLTGRHQGRVSRAVASLDAQGLKAHKLVLDITSDKSVAAAVDQFELENKCLDILINNAAIRIEKYGKKPSQQPLDEWHKTFNSNVLGTVRVTKAFLPLLQKSRAGRIVNVSSLLGSIGTHSNPDSYAYSDMFKSLPAYSASKSAVNSWTAHLAYELRDTPIKVNSVHPGYTKTDMNDGDGEFEVTRGASTSLRMALLEEDGPTGTYVHLDQTVPW